MRIAFSEVLQGILFSPSSLADDLCDGCAHDISIHVSRADRIDRDTSRRDLKSQRTGHPENGMLRCAVAADIRESPQRGDTGDVDNAAPARIQHVLKCDLSAVEDAINVNVHGSLPVGEIEAMEEERERRRQQMKAARVEKAAEEKRNVEAGNPGDVDFIGNTYLKLSFLVWL